MENIHLTVTVDQPLQLFTITQRCVGDAILVSQQAQAAGQQVGQGILIGC